MTTKLYLNDTKGTRDVHCGNCDWTGVEADAGPLWDPDFRLSPGDEIPVGECPECSALCYLHPTKFDLSDMKDRALAKAGGLLTFALANNAWPKDASGCGSREEIESVLAEIRAAIGPRDGESS